MYARAREEFGAHRRAVQQRRHLPRRRRLGARHHARGLAARAGREPAKSVFLCCKHGIPHLLETGGGSVINTASFVAVMGAATSQISYTASKGGVLALSRELGVEFARRGVRVNALCPGPVDTPLLQELFAKDPEKAARRLVHLPMGRFAEAREIANGGAVPGQRRVVLRHRLDVPGRRRAVERLRDSRLASGGVLPPDCGIARAGRLGWVRRGVPVAAPRAGRGGGPAWIGTLQPTLDFGCAEIVPYDMRFSTHPKSGARMERSNWLWNVPKRARPREGSDPTPSMPPLTNPRPAPARNKPDTGRVAVLHDPPGTAPPAQRRDSSPGVARLRGRVRPVQLDDRHAPALRRALRLAGRRRGGARLRARAAGSRSRCAPAATPSPARRSARAWCSTCAGSTASRSTRCGASPASAAAPPGRRSTARPRSTASPPRAGACRRPASPASRSAAARAGSSASTGSPATTCSRPSWSPPAASACARPRPRTRSCCGRCAAAAATSASSRRSS